MSDLTPTALVTGGSRGIGRAIAVTLAAAGLQVYLTYVSKPDEAEQTVSAIEQAGGTARAFRVDVADAASVAAFFQDEIKDKVSLEVLVNNAGITKDGLVLRMKDEDFDRVLGVNLRGAFVCLREAAKIMTRQRRGRIVNIASVVGQMGNAGQINYAAAKAGLIGVTKSAEGIGRTFDHGQCRGSRLYRNRHDGRAVRRSASGVCPGHPSRAAGHGAGRGGRRGLSGFRQGGLHHGAGTGRQRRPLLLT